MTSSPPICRAWLQTWPGSLYGSRTLSSSLTCTSIPAPDSPASNTPANCPALSRMRSRNLAGPLIEVYQQGPCLLHRPFPAEARPMNDCSHAGPRR